MGLEWLTLGQRADCVIFYRVSYARLATLSKTVSGSGSNDNDTGIIYQGMPSSDDRCDLNFVVSTGEDNQSKQYG